MSAMLLALQITALGMGLVFAAILILWAMMSLLTRATADRAPSPGDTATVLTTMDTVPMLRDDLTLKARAAVAAVALALAEKQAAGAHPLQEPPTAIVSAWQLGMRTRQMYQKGGTIGRQARKDDR